jgi:hypothetical protein
VSYSEPDQPAPFIVGTGRSGTSLLRLMFDSHPDLAIPPETEFIHRLRKTWLDSGEQLEPVVATLVGSRRWVDFGLREDELRERLEAGSVATLPELIRCFYRLYAERQGKRRWGDKTPNYVLLIPQIASLLPEARFISVVRDGRDVALSILSMWWGPSSVDEAASWWRERVLAARGAAASHPCVEVRYEDLVANPERELLRLCRFIQLDYRPEMIDSHARAHAYLERLHDLREPAVSAATRRSINVQLTEPVNASRVERWRSEMSEADRRRFEAIAGDTLEEFGYEVGS